MFFVWYIDDIIVNWDGPLETAIAFTQYCNQNPYGISFTRVADPESFVFLALHPTADNTGNIRSKTHFKQVAGNFYLYWRSCHHLLWKKNIPSRQLKKSHMELYYRPRLRRSKCCAQDQICRKGVLNGIPQHQKDKHKRKVLMESLSLPYFNRQFQSILLRDPKLQKVLPVSSF